MSSRRRSSSPQPHRAASPARRYTRGRVGIVGTGVIGSGWAALFCAHDFDVVAFVRSDASEAKFVKALEASWRRLHARGVASNATGWRAVRCVRTLEACARDADYVQESVTEDMHVKLSVLQQLDAIAPPHVLIGTSSSYIPLSLARSRASRHPERVATAHPTVPSLDSFVEVMGSCEAHTAALADLFEKSVNMEAVRLRCESHGFVMNAMINVLGCASVGLVQSGACGAADVDVALRHLSGLMLASGGFGNAMVEVVGGGSGEAVSQLAADVALAMPSAVGAIAISRTLGDGALGRLALRAWLLLTSWVSALAALKRLVVRVVGWLNAPFYAQAAAEVRKKGGAEASEELLLRRMRAVQELAAIGGAGNPRPVNIR